MVKKQSAAGALSTVIDALEPLPENDRRWVLQSAAARWDMPVPVPVPVPVPMQPAAPIHSPSLPHGSVPSGGPTGNVRAFVRAKNPTTDVQRVACLGYYHMQTAGSSGFSGKDLEKLRVDAGLPKFNMTRAIDNATRRSKYLSSGVGRDKQLSPLGEDVVNALPDQQKVSDVEGSNVSGVTKRKGRRKKAKK